MNNYEFVLTEEQLKAAIKKYGKDYVKNVYKKLCIQDLFEKTEFETRQNAKVKINLGNGGFHYKKLKLS